MLDLESIFGDSPAAGRAAPSTGGAPAVALDSPEPVPGPEAGPVADFSDWVLRPDHRGRLGDERADLPEADRWWADPLALAAPGPACPRCASLEIWWDILGGRHCQRCEPEGPARSVALIAKAAELRRRNPPQPKTVAPEARCCVPEALDDLKHLSSNRPTESTLRAVAGCQVG